MKKVETAMLAAQPAAPAALSSIPPAAVEAAQAPTTDAEATAEAKVERKALVDPEGLSPDELKILNTIRARQMLRREDTLSIDNFSNDAIHGYSPVVMRGSLGLHKAGGNKEKVGAKGAAMDNLTGPLPSAIKV